MYVINEETWQETLLDSRMLTLMSDIYEETWQETFLYFRMLAPMFGINEKPGRKLIDILEC